MKPLRLLVAVAGGYQINTDAIASGNKADQVADSHLNFTSEGLPCRSSVISSCIGVFLVALAVTSILGNLLVMVTIVQDRTLRAMSSSMILANLAITDLITGLTVILPATVALFCDHWPLGHVLCQLNCFFNYLLIIVSMMSMALIGWDRCRAVATPFLYNQTSNHRQILSLTLLVWIVAFVFALVPLLCEWVHYDYWEGVCAIDWFQHRDAYIYVITAFIICFVLPSLFILFSYATIANVSKHTFKTKQISPKKVTRITVSEYHRTLTAENVHEEPHSRSVNVHLCNHNSSIGETSHQTERTTVSSSENSDSNSNCFHSIRNVKLFSFDNLSRIVQYFRLIGKTDEHNANTNDTTSRNCPKPVPSQTGTRNGVSEKIWLIKLKRTKSKVHPCTPTSSHMEGAREIQQLSTGIQERQDLREDTLTHDDVNSDLILSDEFGCERQQTNPERFSTPTPRELEVEMLTEDTIDSELSVNSTKRSEHNPLRTERLTPRNFVQTTLIEDDATLTHNDVPIESYQMGYSNPQQPQKQQQHNDDVNLQNVLQREMKEVHQRILRSLIVVVVTFFFCMTPFCVTKLLKILFDAYIIPPWLNLMSTVLQFLASVINPFLYAILRVEFFNGFCRVYTSLKNRCINCFK